jgi:hypothetical protein
VLATEQKCFVNPKLHTGNMTTKTNNLVYWISTIIFSGLMIFSAVGGVKPGEQSIQIIHDGLGYPIYFIQFISK